MKYDAVVVGAGLAGLVAALRLAEEGRSVLVLARGVGSTHLAPGTIDVLGYAGGERVASPAAALPGFVEAHPDHPYARVGTDAVAESVEWLKARADALGYTGSLDENLLLTTALGVARPSAVVPDGIGAGDLRAGGGFVFVGLRGLKDFYSAYVAENLSRSASVTARGLQLELDLGGERDVSPLGFAQRFDRPGFRAAVVDALAGRLEPDERVGFPAVLGLADAPAVRRELEARLERTVFEVPTIPPSVPGIRLYELLRSALRRAGGRLVIGDRVVGAETAGGRVEAVVAETAARRVAYRAASFVLATGGFASGGFELDSHGVAREPILDLPLTGLPEGGGRPHYAPRYLDPQPLERAGLAVDERLRPVDAAGHAVYENVHAAGAALAGAVPWREKSGDGISLATGYAAAAAVLESAAVAGSAR